jgi:hypothetical protein
MRKPQWSQALDAWESKKIKMCAKTLSAVDVVIARLNPFQNEAALVERPTTKIYQPQSAIYYINFKFQTRHVAIQA